MINYKIPMATFGVNFLNTINKTQNSWMIFMIFKCNGWFQKISIPTPQVAFWNSESKGGSVNWKSKGIGVLMIGIQGGWGFVDGTDKSVKTQTNRWHRWLPEALKLMNFLSGNHLWLKHTCYMYVTLLCVSNTYSVHVFINLRYSLNGVLTCKYCS